MNCDCDLIVYRICCNRIWITAETATATINYYRNTVQYGDREASAKRLTGMKVPVFCIFGTGDKYLSVTAAKGGRKFVLVCTLTNFFQFFFDHHFVEHTNLTDFKDYTPWLFLCSEVELSSSLNILVVLLLKGQKLFSVT